MKSLGVARSTDANRWVRFLCPIEAETGHRLLTLLNDWNGEPKFRQLEPDARMAQPACATPSSGLTVSTSGVQLPPSQYTRVSS